MSVTAQNFDDYDWESVVEESDRQIRQDYSRLFAERESNARANGDLEAAELFELLQNLTFSYFDLDTDGSPFPKLPEMEQENLQTLAEVFEEFSDAELRARIGDVLWLHDDRVENGYQFALEAIDAYLESARRLEGALQNQETLRRMRRAAQLAVALNNDEKKAAVQDAVEQRVHHHAAAEDELLAKQFSGILYEGELGSPLEQARILGDVARSLENPNKEDEAPDYHTSRKYWELSAKWLFRAGEEDKAHEARENWAEALVRLGEQHKPAHNLMAVDFYSNALTVLQSVPGSKEWREQIRRVMADTREEAEITNPIKLSPDPSDEETQAETEEEFRGLEVEEVLKRFANVATIDGPEALREQTKEKNRMRPLPAMIPASKHGSRNRKIAMKEGGLDDPEAALEYQVHQTARQEWKRVVINRIEPSHQAISDEHEIGLEELEPFVQNSPLIPPGRELSFAKALVAGFDWDYLSSTHLLSVQLEESLRHLLRKKGVVTTALKGNFEDEHNINNFLKKDDYHEEVVGLLGDKLMWQLRSLLVDVRGSNLRNKVAHALGDDAEYLHRVPSRFLWWLTWHMVVCPPSGVRDLEGRD